MDGLKLGEADLIWCKKKGFYPFEDYFGTKIVGIFSENKIEI